MKRIQNKIAESRIALPVTYVIALVVWLVGGAVERGLYAEFVLFAVSAYLMFEMNNRNLLIRIYSRMVSCSFLILLTMAAPLCNSLDVWVVLLCFTAAYSLIFSCYQDKLAQGRMFYAFMFIGVASVVFRQAFFFVPVLWLFAAVYLSAFSFRNLFASLFGLALPYWLALGYCVATDNIDYFVAHFTAPQWVTPLDYSTLPDYKHIATISLVAVATIIGAVHFLRTSYKDKIRTRMIYDFVIYMALVTFAFIVLQPQHFDVLFGILAINSSILIAHFFALTSTRLTNIVFGIFVLAVVVVTVINYLPII